MHKVRYRYWTKLQLDNVVKWTFSKNFQLFECGLSRSQTSGFSGMWFAFPFLFPLVDLFPGIPQTG